ncbi:hypothetical protein PVAND_017478 [Polypedilum vanderplanki]|uniref:Uncharacterized protein n=1 Tax=Polypedilum vanderplanki TaxID=319348 RepID=A0A9J6BJ63_POLVA|nr:hypothetical protein PVAND_017478 [Polypedilum vanderplanki]
MEVLNQFNSIDRSENSKIVAFPSKLSANKQKTNIKLPFKDATNKSNDLQKSETKIKNNEIKTNKTPEIEEFHFPNHGNCFCCGDDRKFDTEEARIFLHLSSLMNQNCRIPEEEKFDLNEKDLPKFLPINYDERDSDSFLNPDDYWIKFDNTEKTDEDDEKNSSICSIPEFIDDSLELNESL